MNIEYTQGETERTGKRKYMVGKQDGAKYLLIMLTYELGLETADELFWKISRFTDAPFALAVIELSRDECVRLDTEQIVKDREGIIEITSSYFPFGGDKALSPKNTCPECILPTQGKSIGFGAAKYGRNDKSYEKSDCAMMLLDELEADIVPVLINELELDEDVRVILGGHGMAGMFAVWAGHMSDSFFSIAAVSPAPIPKWWEGFTKQYYPLAGKMYVSYGSEELSAVSDAALYRRLHYPMMSWTHIHYHNDRLYFQAQREGGHNDNVIDGQAAAFAWGMGFFGGLFIDGDTLVSYSPRKGVTKVVIPDGITKIASDAFRKCGELTEVVIPEGVTAIGDNAFYECRALKDITIPKSLNRIGSYAFSNTQWMKDRQEDFVIVNDVLIKYKGNDTTVYVPDGVRELSAPAFNGRKTPEVIYLPESFIEFEYTSFWGCDNLREIRIPKPNPQLKVNELLDELPGSVKPVIGDRENKRQGSSKSEEEGNAVYEENPIAAPAKEPEKPYIEEVLANVSWELPPLPCIRFSIKKGRTTQLSSKLGGLPYFPKSMELPKDSEGNTMRLLAQLNLEELPYLRDMPQKGILQFFISNAHDMFGMNEDDLTDQSDFRVIYHREILDKDQLITENDLPEYKNEYGDFPFEGEFRLVPNAPDVMQPTFFDHRMEEVFIECYNELSAEEITSAFDIGSDDYNNICERNGKIEAFTGGYPYFTQEDPRSHDYGLKDFDTVLFELNSISDEENDIEIMFGDMGTATFLIPRGNLKKHDFSRVAYNYDCG